MKINRNNYAFIDSQNLNLGIKSQEWQLDFEKFFIFIKDKFSVKKAFLFIGYISKNKHLYKKLEKIGYKLIFKPSITSSNGNIKGNVDVELVLHSMIEYNNYEKAIIVSSDGDFYCLIDYLEKKEKLEYLVIPNRKIYSSLYKEFYKRGRISFLSGMKDKIGKLT